MPPPITAVEVIVRLGRQQDLLTGHTTPTAEACFRSWSCWPPPWCRSKRLQGTGDAGSP